MIDLPKPSMSMASLEAKNMSFWRFCAGQSGLIHLQAASVSSLTNSLLQDGQCVGNLIGISLPVRTSSKALTMYGITSPALSTTTMSPSLRSRLSMNSSLCSETDEIVTPANATGSSLPTGVTEPILPIWYSTSISLVAPCLA